MISSPRWSARPATAGLVGLCSVVFVVCVLALGARAASPLDALFRSLWVFEDVELLESAGALAATRVWRAHEWWRVLSCGFLHGSWLHLVLNMMGLWAVGQWTEKVWGPWRQLGLFLVSSVGGCLASLAWAEAPVVVGASAGIFGVAGALVVARAWGREEIREALEPISARSLGFWLILWLVVGAILPLIGVSLLAQAGHVGGLAFGCVVGWGFSRRKEQRLIRVLSPLIVFVGLVGLVIASNAPTWRSNYHVMLGSEAMGEGDHASAGRHFEDALTLDDDPSLENAVAYWFAEEGIFLERAEELVEGALAEDPNNANYLDTLGWVQCKLGRVEEGRRSLEAAQAGRRRRFELLERVLPVREIPEISEHLELCAEVGSLDRLGDVPRETASGA